MRQVNEKLWAQHSGDVLYRERRRQVAKLCKKVEPTQFAIDSGPCLGRLGRWH